MFISVLHYIYIFFLCRGHNGIIEILDSKKLLQCYILVEQEFDRFLVQPLAH